MSLVQIPFHDTAINAIETDEGVHIAIKPVAEALGASWVAHIALIIMLTAIGPDSLLIAALGLLVARTLWTLTPKATLS